MDNAGSKVSTYLNLSIRVCIPLTRLVQVSENQRISVADAK